MPSFLFLFFCNYSANAFLLNVGLASNPCLCSGWLAHISLWEWFLLWRTFSPCSFTLSCHEPSSRLLPRTKPLLVSLASKEAQWGSLAWSSSFLFPPGQALPVGHVALISVTNIWAVEHFLPDHTCCVTSETFTDASIWTHSLLCILSLPFSDLPICRILKLGRRIIRLVSFPVQRSSVFPW